MTQLQIARRAALSALTIAALPAAAAAQAFAYKPTTQQYRVDQHVATSQDMMGTTTDSDVKTFQLITMTLGAPANGALPVSFVVDSISTTVGGNAPDAQLAPARAQAAQQAARTQGRRVNGTVTPRGVARTMVAAGDTTDVEGAQLATGFRGFLIGFPAGGVKAGTTWTDTTTTPIANPQLTGSNTSIITYRVAGDTTVNGRAAWRVTRDGVITITGAGSNQGMQLTMKGTGKMAGTSIVAKDGTFLGGMSETDVTSTIELPAMGASIPVTQTVTTKVTPVAR